MPSFSCLVSALPLPDPHPPVPEVPWPAVAGLHPCSVLHCPAPWWVLLHGLTPPPAAGDGLPRACAHPPLVCACLGQGSPEWPRTGECDFVVSPHPRAARSCEWHFVTDHRTELTMSYVENTDVRERHPPVAACTPPSRDLARNPGTCSDWELHLQPFGFWDDAQPTEPRQPGRSHVVL